MKPTHSLGAEEIVVKGSKPFPGVIATVGSAHQVLNDQADVNQTDSVVRREVALEIKSCFIGTGKHS